MRLLDSRSVKEILKLYNECFLGLKSDDTKSSDALALDTGNYTGHEDPIVEKLKLTPKDSSEQGVWGWLERTIVGEHVELPKIFELKSKRLYLSGHHKEALFLKDIRGLCGEYQAKASATKEGCLITSLAVWVCEQLDNERDHTIREKWFIRFINFISEVIRSVALGNPNYNLDARKALVQIREDISKRVDEEQRWIKANKMRVGLEKLNLQNIGASLDDYLLSVLSSLDFPSNFFTYLNRLEYGKKKIIDLSYEEFKDLCNQKLFDTSERAVKLMMDEKVFDCIKKFFLVPSSFSESLQKYYAAEEAVEACEIHSAQSLPSIEWIGDSKEVILTGRSQFQAFFPNYPVSSTHGDSIDARIYELLPDVFKARNELYILNFYSGQIKILNDSLGNLVKILAEGQLKVWCDNVEKALKGMKNALVDLKRLIIDKYTKHHNMPTEWHRNFHESIDFPDTILSEIEAHIQSISMIRESISEKEIVEDMEKVRHVMQTVSHGMSQFFGYQPQLSNVNTHFRVEGIKPNLSGAEEIPAITNEATNKYLRDKNSKLELSLLMKDIPEYLREYGFSEEEVNYSIEKLEKFIKSKEEEPEHMRMFTQHAKHFVVDGMLALKRFEYYVDAYSNYNLGLDCMSRYMMFDGGFHGETGRARALELKRKWQQKVKFQLYGELLDNLFQSFISSHYETFGMLPCYSAHLNKTENEFMNLLKNVEGNFHKHSLKSYLLAYYKELKGVMRIEHKFDTDDIYQNSVEKMDSAFRKLELTKLFSEAKQCASSNIGESTWSKPQFA